MEEELDLLLVQCGKPNNSNSTLPTNSSFDSGDYRSGFDMKDKSHAIGGEQITFILIE